MRKSLNLLCASVLLIVLFSCSTNKTVEQRIADYISNYKADIGVAAFCNNDVISYNGSISFPMQSVYKFQIALSILNSVDRGELALDDYHVLTAHDLSYKMYSPLMNVYNIGDSLHLSELIRYAVAESDNVACDILLEVNGGAGRVNNYIKELGFDSILICNTEREMHIKNSLQYSNTSTAIQMMELLRLSFINEPNILSEQTHLFLWNTMLNTKTGKNRLKSKLPSSAEVFHKTGTSDLSADGFYSAVNDVGVIKLPDCDIFIAIFVSNSSESLEINEKIIADIAELVYIYYTKSASCEKVS